nr:MAG TPA: hypothetical protein [Caudoviricetes sp.]
MKGVCLASTYILTYLVSVNSINNRAYRLISSCLYSLLFIHDTIITRFFIKITPILRQLF